jgi:hypothetical protein
VTSDSITSVERQYDRAGVAATATVTLLWHLISAFPTALSGWSVYRPVGTGVYVWVAYLVIGGALAVLLLRGGGRSFAAAAITVPLLLAGSAVVAIASPGHGPTGHFSWAFTSSPWFAVLALWRRPLREFLGYWVLNVVVGAAVLMAAGQTDRISVASFVGLGYSIHVLQLAFLLGGRTLTRLAAQVAAAQAATASSQRRMLAARAIHQARQARLQVAQESSAELLSEMASGTLRLDDDATQRRIRVAVSRLRLLLVETDDVPDPLQNDLAACADAAQRRGIDVDLQPAVGETPALSIADRKTLTEPAIHILSVAESWARITTVVYGNTISVAIVADTPYSGLPSFPNTDFAQVDNERLWAQTSLRLASSDEADSFSSGMAV